VSFKNFVDLYAQYQGQGPDSQGIGQGHKPQGHGQRPRTWKCVLKDPRGQGHVLKDSITAEGSRRLRTEKKEYITSKI